MLCACPAAPPISLPYGPFRGYNPGCRTPAAPSWYHQPLGIAPGPGRRGMNWVTLVIVCVALWSTCQTCEDPAAGQLRKLQGEWILVETADGKRVDRGDDRIRMLIEGRQVTMTFFGRVTNRGGVGVGLGKGVNTLGLGLGNGRTGLGVYEPRGGTVVICQDEAGNGRPRTLAPKGTQCAGTWGRIDP